VTRLRGAAARIPGEGLAAGSAVVLAAALFALKWYGFAGSEGPIAPRAAPSASETGWHALTTLRWVMIATVVVTLVGALLASLSRSAAVSFVASRLGTAFGAVTAILLVYRVLVALPGHGTIVDQKFGAVLGLAAAVGVTYGGYESARRTRRIGGRVVQQSSS
jgi:hypothetical protein